MLLSRAAAVARLRDQRRALRAAAGRRHRRARRALRARGASPRSSRATRRDRAARRGHDVPAPARSAGLQRRPAAFVSACPGAAPCPWELAEEWRARTGVRIVRGYGMTELFRPISYLADEPTRPARVRSAARCPAWRSAWWTTPAGRCRPARPASCGSARRRRWTATSTAQRRRAPCSSTAGSGPATWRAITRRRLRRDRGPQARAHQARRLLGVPGGGGGRAARPSGGGRGRRGGRAATRTLGEEVAAFVTLRPGPPPTPTELIAWCRERLAAYKYPRRVIIVAELPQERDRQDPTRAPALSAARPPSPPR